jgi:hypothetical protein
MTETLRQDVRERAGYRCEYCQLSEEHAAVVPFQVEHAIARQHGGITALSNLALSCHHCNLHKGPNLTGIDPKTKRLTRLFHPRRHVWRRHFRWDGPLLVGRTAVGRTTIAVLAANLPDRLQLRRELIEEGVFPPP